MTEPMKITLDAYQVIEKVVKAGGNSGRVYVPREWVNKRVKIILMEPADIGSEYGLDND
jgi:putative transposon-encoded protein